MKYMKNNKWIRTIAAVLMMILCILTAASAFAGTSTERSRSGGGDSSAINSLPPFKFEKHKYGIGYGNCPVYTAPTESAYRSANGKASVATDGYEVDDAGWVDGWLLVRYQIKTGWRVGYIPPKFVKGFKSSMSAHFGYIPCVADAQIYVTDNPYSHTDSIGLMDEGEEFHVLSRYNYYAKEGYDWWYIECYIDGQVARGFIDVNEAFHVE